MFTKLTKPQYPPRHWSIYGPPGVGKSSLAARLRGPLLVIDADHRFGEVQPLALADVYLVSENPADHNDAERIALALQAGMGPGVAVGTIVIDSLTAILSPLVVKAIAENDAGEHKNKMAAWKGKALAMRRLQDEVTRWGCDTCWIFHEREGMDSQARTVVSPSIPRTELARLQRSLNLRIRVQLGKDGRHGVKVDWARSGRQGIELWDDSGTWLDFPAKIESAVYGGLTVDQQAAIAAATPTAFAGPDLAIAWGYEVGAFDDLIHARNAYDKVKREAAPKTAAAMWAAWIADVQRRLLELEHGAGAEIEAEQAF